MLVSVLKYESHLLHSSEIDFIDRLNQLPCAYWNQVPRAIQSLVYDYLFVHVDSTKYLLIRLCLRKPGRWHRLNSLRYQHELREDITTVLETLCVHPGQY